MILLETLPAHRQIAVETVPSQLEFIRIGLVEMNQVVTIQAADADLGSIDLLQMGQSSGRAQRDRDQPRILRLRIPARHVYPLRE